MQENWKSIEEHKPDAKHPYAYDIEYVMPFGVSISLETKECLSIVSARRLKAEMIIDFVVDHIYNKLENDDQHKLIPRENIETIKIVGRYCPKKEILTNGLCQD